MLKGEKPMKPVESWPRSYANRSLRAFLDGSQNLNWLIGVIRSSGVEGSTLAELFESHRGHSNRPRYEEAVNACRQEGLLLKIK